MKTLLIKEAEIKWADRELVDIEVIPSTAKRVKNFFGRHWLGILFGMAVASLAGVAVFGNTELLLQQGNLLNKTYGSVLFGLGAANIFKYGFMRKRYKVAGAENKIYKHIKKLEKKKGKNFEETLNYYNNIQNKITKVLDDAKVARNPREKEGLLKRFLELQSIQDNLTKQLIERYNSIANTNEKVVKKVNEFYDLILKIQAGKAIGKIFMTKYEPDRYDGHILTSSSYAHSAQMALGTAFMEAYNNDLLAHDIFKNYTLKNGHRAQLRALMNKTQEFIKYDLKSHVNRLVIVNNEVYQTRVKPDVVYDKLHKEVEKYETTLEKFVNAFKGRELEKPIIKKVNQTQSQTQNTEQKQTQKKTRTKQTKTNTQEQTATQNDGQALAQTAEQSKDTNTQNVEQPKAENKTAEQPKTDATKDVEQNKQENKTAEQENKDEESVKEEVKQTKTRKSKKTEEVAEQKSPEENSENAKKSIEKIKSDLKAVEKEVDNLERTL